MAKIVQNSWKISNLDAFNNGTRCWIVRWVVVINKFTSSVYVQ